MTRKPDTPCTVCGALLWRSSVPPNQRVCRPCKAAAPSASRVCSTCNKPTRGERCRPCTPVGRVCVICGVRYRRTYSAQRTCGRTCGAKLNVRERPPRPPKLPAPAIVWPTAPCTVCGTPYEREQKNARFCSRACGIKHHNDVKAGACATRACRQCGQQFVAGMDRTRRAVYCSKRCGKRHMRKTAPSYQARNHRQRARRNGVAYESFPASYIYQRDRWRCGLCGKPINPQLKCPDLMSKSLDHIVPLARGGAHTKANVQAAHLGCNSLKQDKVTQRGEQLMLFG